MKKSIVVGAIVVGLVASAIAQDIVIDSISRNGTMSFWGAEVGTTATVEWAASLTDAGRTNWHGLTNVVVAADIMTNDIPMFFRVRGTPDTNLLVGLVAYYPFNGNANDESGKGNNGTVFGPTLTTDRFGNSDSAYLFDGVSTYIAMGSAGMPTDDRTISIWLKRTEGVAGAPWKVMLGYGGNGDGPSSCYATINGNKLHLGPHWYGGLNANVDVATNVWHHYVVTVKSSVGQLYWDGAPIETTGSFPPTFLSGGPLLIGVNVSGSGVGPYTDENIGYWPGALDDIRIYNRALSSNEVRRLYHLPH